jgi:hypothetical protein
LQLFPERGVVAHGAGLLGVVNADEDSIQSYR